MFISTAAQSLYPIQMAHPKNSANRPASPHMELNRREHSLILFQFRLACSLVVNRGGT